MGIEAAEDDRKCSINPYKHGCDWWHEYNRQRKELNRLKQNQGKETK